MTLHRGGEVELLPLCGPTDAQAQTALALLQPLLLRFLLSFYCSCSSSVCIAAGMRRLLQGYGAWWERPESEPLGLGTCTTTVEPPLRSITDASKGLLLPRRQCYAPSGFHGSTLSRHSSPPPLPSLSTAAAAAASSCHAGKANRKSNYRGHSSSQRDGVVVY